MFATRQSLAKRTPCCISHLSRFSKDISTKHIQLLISKNTLCYPRASLVRTTARNFSKYHLICRIHSLTHFFSSLMSAKSSYAQLSLSNNNNNKKGDIEIPLCYGLANEQKKISKES